MTATPRFALAATAFLSLSLAASAREPQSCRVVFPTFEPQTQARAAPEAARFPGGARRYAPVVAPCRRAPRPAAA